MMRGFLMSRRNMLIGAAGLLLTAMLTIWGCGGGGTSYDNPASNAVVTTTTTQSGNALVTAAELKAWIDEGKVNAAYGSYDRVVILDVTSNAADGTNVYTTTGHIPGAQLISAGSSAFMDNTRAEGPMNITGSMVCTGATMDELIQSKGIDQHTTVVITSSTNTINMTRAYATLRYWGFPKNRIKVLQGGNASWTAAGYTFTTAVPTIKRSTHCVTPNGSSNVNTEMRVSLGEMINYVKSVIAGNANKVVVLDTIRPATHITSTTDLLESGYTVFEGAMKGSYRYPYANVVTSGLNFKDAATLKTDLSAAIGTDGVTALTDGGRDAAKTFIAVCRAGNAASVVYFALDGIAYYDSNVDIKWYDGSYGQWNLLASSDHLALNGTNAGGKLAVGSIWDTTSLMDNLTWTKDITPARTVVNYGNRVFTVEPSFAEGNQVETEDKAYRSAGGGATGGSASGGGC